MRNELVLYTERVRQTKAAPVNTVIKEEAEMFNENVVRILENNMWDVATCADGEPNVIPIAFKGITADGKLTFADVFLETTLKNLKANGGKIAISAYDAKTLEGYQIKGTAEYLSDGPIVEDYKKKAEALFNGAQTARGALLITPDKVIVTTPGAENKKELEL